MLSVPIDPAKFQNPLTTALSEYRTRQTLAFNALVRAPAGVDLAAVTSLVYGGMVYLLLKSSVPGKFNELDLKDDAAWARIEKAVHRLLEGLYPAAKR